MIKIQEVNAFGQVITGVIKDEDLILDLRKGGVSEHAKTSARYHAAKEDQGLVVIQYIDGSLSHLTVKDPE